MQRTSLWLAREGEGGGMNGETRTSILIHTLLYIDLLYNTGDPTQHSEVKEMGRRSEKECIFICVSGSLCCTMETDTTL